MSNPGDRLGPVEVTEEEGMTAVTLSTLASHSLTIHGLRSAPNPAPGFADGGRTGAAAHEHVLKVSEAGHASPPERPATPPGRPETAPEPQAATRGGAQAPHGAQAANVDVLEHQARGLLNLVALLSRCVEGGMGSPAERSQWADEVKDAKERLEALYESGLPRTFLSAPPTKPAGVSGGGAGNALTRGAR